ncbi:MAG: hypothetical protein AB7P12_15310 [Alphaproteobacteria bacterium]
MNPAAVLRDARFSVCRAFQTGGPEAALAALGAASIRLCRLVRDGDLLWPVVFKNLLQVAVNLRLPVVYGRRSVQVAIYAGCAFYDDIEAANDERKAA